MIKKYRIEENKLAETAVNEQVLVLVNPDDNEKEFILNNFEIDPHNFTSSLDQEEPARVEFESNHLEVIFKRPKNYSSKDHFLFKVSSMGLFLFEEKLVIIISEDLNLFSGKYFNHVTGVKEVFLKVLYNSIYHFIEHLKIINMIADEIETKLNKSMENKYLLHMFTLEKSLVYYVSAIGSNSFVLEKLKLQGQKCKFSEKGVEFMEDLVIENSQAKTQADVYSQVFSGLMDARASVINNNMNIWLKNLTLITVSIAIPNFFASIGGMSEVYAITGISNPRVAHLSFFFFCAMLGVITYFVLKRIEKS